MTTPSSPELPVESSWQDDLVDRSYRTYKARINTAVRLRVRNHVWNTVLISATTSSAIAGIALVADSKLFGEQGSTIFAAMSVLVLAASLVVTGKNYEGRSRDMFDNYRKIQRLSAKAEMLVKQKNRLSKLVNHRSILEINRELEKLFDDYQDLLDASENHTPSDHKSKKTSGRPRSKFYLKSGVKPAVQQETTADQQCSEGASDFGKRMEPRVQDFITYGPLILLAPSSAVLLKIFFWAF
ncbi:SLATT domain-containing protein [Rhodococcus sp. AB351]|uniref:SLATT domain-containing protein n=1 Tax=Rhodococcus sp. AB351 TaxID=3413280 RepID=UPI003C18D820